MQKAVLALFLFGDTSLKRANAYSHDEEIAAFQTEFGFMVKNPGEACQQSYECGSSLQCVDGQCASKAYTERNQQSAAGRKVLGEACESDARCPDGFVCLDGFCYKPKSDGETCTKDEECEFWLDCVESNASKVCRSRCTYRCSSPRNYCVMDKAWAQKRDKYNKGLCLPKKTEGEDCAADHECKGAMMCAEAEKKCRSKSGTEGRKTEGDRCKDHHECKDQMMCIGLGYCGYKCSEDTDCYGPGNPFAAENGACAPGKIPRRAPDDFVPLDNCECDSRTSYGTWDRPMKDKCGGVCCARDEYCSDGQCVPY